MYGGSIGRVEEHRRGRISAVEGTVVSHVGSNTSGVTVALGQHRHGGVAAMDPLGGKHMRLDQLLKR
jgi:hypothetical protein